MEISLIPIKELKAAKYNPRKISKSEMRSLVQSIKTYGLVQPIVINKNFVIVGGHMRVEAARRLKYKKVPCVFVDLDEVKEKELNIALNKISGEWDTETLTELLNELATKNRLAYTGFTEKELEKLRFKQNNQINRKLIEDYIIPPFSIFDTRQGYWQKRKKEWLQYFGGTGGEGREDELLSVGMNTLSELTNRNLTGTSIFDPVLTEVLYTWYTNEGDFILDPFAGGITRGIVASVLGRIYLGTDIRKEQVEENLEKAATLKISGVKWVLDSGENIGNHTKEKANLIFTCPPYYDLEIYDKENQNDLSTAKTYDDFIERYAKVMHNTYDLLAPTGWAIIVVGNVRDKQGNYYNFVGDTVRIMQEAGYHFYNEIILATAIGTATLRARSTFNASKKVVKTHQNILFFSKDKEVAINKALREVLLEGRTATAHKDILVFKK